MVKVVSYPEYHHWKQSKCTNSDPFKVWQTGKTSAGEGNIQLVAVLTVVAVLMLS